MNQYSTRLLRHMPVTAMLGLMGGMLFAQTVRVPTVDHLPPGELLSDAKEIPPQGVELRAVYPKGISLTKLSEGWVPHLYNDAADYCTIGYGHLIQKAP